MSWSNSRKATWSNSRNWKAARLRNHFFENLNKPYLASLEIIVQLIKPPDHDEPYPAVQNVSIQNKLTTDNVTGSRISKEDWFGKKGKTKLLRQSVLKCHCDHIHLEHRTAPNTSKMLWSGGCLDWGGKLSVLTRSCFWQCCGSKLYRMCSFWSWWPTLSFAFCWLTTAFTIQTKNTRVGAVWTPGSAMNDTRSQNHHTQTHTPLYSLQLEGKWKEYLYISVTQNIHFRSQVNTFIQGEKGTEKHLFLDDGILQPSGRWGAVTKLELMWWRLAEWHLSSNPSPSQAGWWWRWDWGEGFRRRGVTVGHQQQRAPGCSGRWWQQTGPASQWEDPGQWRLARQRYQWSCWRC